MPGRVGEAGLGVSQGRVYPKEVVVRRAPDQILVCCVIALVTKVEAADGIVDDVPEQRAVQADFLAQLVVRKVLDAESDLQRREVVVLAPVRGVAAESGDRLQ